MSCKDIVPNTAVIIFVVMIKVIAMKLAKSLILGNRYLISIICMLLLACRIFSVNNYSNCNGVARVPCALEQEIFLRPRQQKLQNLK